MIAFSGYVNRIVGHRLPSRSTQLTQRYGPTEPSEMVCLLHINKNCNRRGRDRSTDTGKGLFLGSGRSIARAGPGGAVMAVALMGTVISSVISCVGEMTALMPVNAPMMEFPRRFLDRGVGFAVGWVYWCAAPRNRPRFDPTDRRM